MIDSPTLPFAGYSESQRYGASVEAWVLQQLKPRFPWAALISDWSANFDISVSPALVEVKAARPYACNVRSGRVYWRWSFEVGRLQPIDHIVILVCEDRNSVRYPFIIPSWFLSGRSQVHVTSHPLSYVARGRGWLCPFLWAWSNVNQVQYQVLSKKQLPLFN